MRWWSTFRATVMTIPARNTQSSYAEQPCYPPHMIKDNKYRIGDGPRRMPVWLDHWPVFLDGLDRLPHVGDRFEVDGELWRVVEIYHRIICEREPS